MARGGEEEWPGPEHRDAAAASPEQETEEERAERERLDAARRHFRAAPPYCIRFEPDGRVSLRRKHFSPWGKPDPAAATVWKLLSLHADLEEAERRLRHITSPAVYYDAHGQVAAGPPRKREREEGEPGW